METKTFKTLIKNEHKAKAWVGNEYVIGRISGVLNTVYRIHGGEIEHGMYIGKDGRAIIVVEGTEEMYKQACDIVEDMYPGLCVFDYEE